MNSINNKREKILSQPGYWVEGINGLLYDSIVSYMEEHEMNNTKLAEHLGISPGRVSQILNDGEINFSIGKVVELALKIDKYPVFKLKSKQDFFKHEENVADMKNLQLDYDPNAFVQPHESETESEDLISLLHNDSETLQFSL